MKRTCALALAATGMFVSAVPAETIVNLDLAIIGNDDTTFFIDDFSSGVFEQPPWVTVSGSPGPEAGGTLTLHGGDTIAAVLAEPIGASQIGALAQMTLTAFPAGSAATLSIFGDEPGESMSLTVTPDALIGSDGGGVLGTVPLLDPLDFVLFTVGVNGGTAFGVETGTQVFAVPSSFGPLTGLAISVVPEPATLVLMTLAGWALARRRSVRR